MRTDEVMWVPFDGGGVVRAAFVDCLEAVAPAMVLQDMQEGGEQLRVGHAEQVVESDGVDMDV